MLIYFLSICCFVCLILLVVLLVNTKKYNDEIREKIRSLEKKINFINDVELEKILSKMDRISR